MTSILLAIQKRIVSEVLSDMFQSHADITVYTVPEIGLTVQFAKAYHPGIIIIEAPEKIGQQTDEYLKCCAVVRKHLPKSRLVHLWPDKSSTSMIAAMTALKAHQVDDFLFCDFTLENVLSTILPSFSIADILPNF